MPLLLTADERAVLATAHARERLARRTDTVRAFTQKRPLQRKVSMAIHLVKISRCQTTASSPTEGKNEKVAKYPSR